MQVLAILIAAAILTLALAVGALVSAEAGVFWGAALSAGLVWWLFSPVEPRQSPLRRPDDAPKGETRPLARD